MRHKGSGRAKPHWQLGARPFRSVQPGPTGAVDPPGTAWHDGELQPHPKASTVVVLELLLSDPTDLLGKFAPRRILGSCELAFQTRWDGTIVRCSILESLATGQSG